MALADVIHGFLERLTSFETPDLKQTSEETMKVFLDALSKESDRAVVIIAVCLLDDLLEKLIIASFIDDPHVKTLFRNEHILQTFYAKINIAYFSGLIPKFVYHDLKILCEIRNRFAHEITENLDLSHQNIVQKLKDLTLGPKTLDEIVTPKWKLMLALQQIVDILTGQEDIISKINPPVLMELLPLKEEDWQQAALTKEKILDIIRTSKSDEKNGEQKA